MGRILVALGLVLLLVKFSRSCYHSQYTDREVCNSFDELDADGTEKWTNVIVQRGSTAKPLVVLPENSFIRTPNLVELSIHELVRSIEPGAFQGLTRLDKLFIFDNNFKTIDPGIFRGLTTRQIQLINNSMTDLPQEIFKEVPRVRVVTIDKNNIKVIRAGTFNGSAILKLYLYNNGIETIEEGAFFNMRSMTTLNLSGNKLSTFDSKLLLGENPTLGSLWLSKNQFTKITNNMFTTLPFLEQIFMEMNQITEIEPDAFLKVPQLEFLDVSNNLIEEIHPSIATKKGLPRMGVFFVHNNRLTFINTVLLSKFPKLMYITIGGNPFQCPCLNQIKNWLHEKNITQLCDDAYYSGEKPSCVISTISSTSCIYDNELHKDLYQLYVEALSEYGPSEQLKCDTTDGFQAAKLKKLT